MHHEFSMCAKEINENLNRKKTHHVLIRNSLVIASETQLRSRQKYLMSVMSEIRLFIINSSQLFVRGKPAYALTLVRYNYTYGVDPVYVHFASWKDLFTAKLFALHSAPNHCTPLRTNALPYKCCSSLPTCSNLFLTACLLKLPAGELQL